MKEDSLIGTQLANYRIERVLGRGGMAVVYGGRDVKLNRLAAIKVIDHRYRSSPVYAERFIQEARTVAAWRHENIIQIYYADDADGLYYFAMEYIDGENLADLLGEYALTGELVPHADVLHVGWAIAAALDYAHQHGVIHRDVKPSNVFIERSGRVVLGDFGLALDTQQGSLGEVFGTAHYIAPEQARRSNAAVPESDLYSLGVILYEMLTGTVPFDDPSPSSVALQHMTAPPPLPREVNPALSADVEEVLLRALSKLPEERYGSGAELMDALEEALEASPEPTAAYLLQSPAPRLVRQLSEVSFAERVALPAVSPTGRARQQAAAARAAPNSPREAPTADRSKTLTRLMLLGTVGSCALSLCLFFVVAAMLLSSLSGRSKAVVRLVTVTPTGYAATGSGVEVADLSPANAAALPATPEPTQTIPSPLAPTEASLPYHSPEPPTLTVPVLPSATISSPTATAAPVVIAAGPGPTAVPTIRYPEGRRFMFYYDENSFYMLQVDGSNSPISPITFEHQDAAGVPLKTFSGRSWAKFYATTRPGNCMSIEIAGGGPFLRPDVCKNRTMSVRTPVRDDAGVFWTRGQDSTYFRVLWQDEEVARCEINAGTCEAYIP